MSGFWRDLWTGWTSARTQRWALPPFAALGFHAAMTEPSGWRWFCLALGVAYTIGATWLWLRWAERRKFHRILAEAARDMRIETPDWLGEWRGRRG